MEHMVKLRLWLMKERRSEKLHLNVKLVTHLVSKIKQNNKKPPLTRELRIRNESVIKMTSLFISGFFFYSLSFFFFLHVSR